MSNVSVILDTIRSTLQSTFPLKTQVPNPYAVERNSDVFLEDGYGIIIRTGSISPDIQEFCQHDFEMRGVDILFTRRCYRVDVDTEYFHTQTKNLLEDTLTFKKVMLSNNQLGIDSNLVKIDLESDTGVNFIFANETSFLYTIVRFNAHYSY